MIKKIVKAIIPKAILSTLKNYKILSVDYGQYQTMKHWDCIDKYKDPIPWYSYPAIEFLKQLDFSQKRIFEYGSGNSTLFWAKRSKEVYVVEDDKAWYDKIKAKVPENVTYQYADNIEAYTTAIQQYPGKFDIIIIDGNHRYECAKAALEKLEKHGFFILDNSDWSENTSALLRTSDLIEVDMSGFGPINGYTWVTSFYLSRDVILKPVAKRQPSHMTGNLKIQAF